MKGKVFLAVVIGSMISATVVAGSEAELFDAVKAGDKQEVQRLLEEGAEVNVYDDNLNSPLFYAIGRGDAALVRQLVDAGALIRYDHRRETGPDPLENPLG